MRKIDKRLVKDMFDNERGMSRKFECVDVDNDGRSFTLMDDTGNLMVVFPKQMVHIDACVAGSAVTTRG